ncbi:2-isopropylmalate synthase [Marinicauda sp. Alg238-R41]|uniref:2-isopropylmalate synthase n=1 Tax=Marinicauda sp. Alg238-R41 TaxID=2993447 RepID=UPI0022E464F2|nr:2-isopropylmalate synthase [Marinicauda sp. Alg238-R41]
MTQTVKIFDTTLRDGEQAPGFSMTEAGKLKMAHALAALKVDVIEAGFAAASPGDSQAIYRIASEVEGPTICSLARAAKGDIEASAKALKPAKNRRIHVFLGTSPLHREHKLNMTPAEILERIGSMVAYAREFADDVEFSAEDAIRTEPGFLIEALSTAAKAGATTLNVPDTVGYATPDEIYQLFRQLSQKVSRPAGVIFSAHCHDDLGMAVANSLAAVRGGARQIECAVNGIGERAGNCALEDAVMALRTRRDAFGIATGIDTTKIMAASRTLSQVTNTHTPRNKAIVGANAFAHESGIHQHGVLRNRETYEIMRPEDVGLASNQIVLGKHSGKHALKARAAELGYTLDGPALEAAFVRFKAIADEVGLVDSARLTALLSEEAPGTHDPDWRLSKLEIRTPLAANAHPVARVELEHVTRGRISDLAAAPGALDATYQAVSQIMDAPARVADIDMQYIAAEAEEAGADGQGADVLVELKAEAFGEIFTGRARARDIIPACVSAYVDALNNALAVQRRRAARATAAA